MDAFARIAGLRERKRLLLLESEVNRQSLRLDLHRISAATGQLRRGLFAGHTIWKWAIPLLGFLLGRRSKAANAVAKGSLLMALLQGGWKLLQRRKKLR